MNRVEEYVERIRAEMGPTWLPQIYRERILTMRTRAYNFPPLSKPTQTEIHHTLLGIELKVGRQRMLCPDLATARYLAVFARLGSKAVAVPYDITTVSSIADDLESAWHRMLLLADELTRDAQIALRARLHRRLVGKVSMEIAQAGAGRAVPEFKQSTRQRTEPRKGHKSTKAMNGK